MLHENPLSPVSGYEGEYTLYKPWIPWVFAAVGFYLQRERERERERESERAIVTNDIIENRAGSNPTKKASVETLKETRWERYRSQFNAASLVLPIPNRRSD